MHFLFAVVITIAADRQVEQLACQRFQPFEGIIVRLGPIGVGYDADLEVHRVGHFHPAKQQRVIQERLAAFKINGIDAGCLRLAQDVLDLRGCERAALPGAAPHEAMVTFKGALVGEQNMET